MFEVRHLEPFEGSGNAFPIFFQPPLAPVLAWPQDLSKLRAFLSCLKCAGLILVKMPPGCRISKLKAITAASSEEAVSDRRSCATWGAVAGGHGKNPHKGEVRVQLPLPTLLLCPRPSCGSARRRLCGADCGCCSRDLLYRTWFVLYLHSPNCFGISLRLRGPCTVTAVT